MYRSLPEKIWFESHQLLLLRIVNSVQGRELLGIDLSFPDIVEINSNYIKGFRHQNKDGDIDYVTELRSSNKWGNVIRFKWFEFQRLAKSFYDSGDLTNIWLDEKWQLAATTSTFHPEASPGPNSCDGYVEISNAGNWASSRDASVGIQAGVFDPSLSNNFTCEFRTVINDYMIGRGFFIYDTSSIDSGDSISSEIVSFAGNGQKRDDYGTKIAHIVVSSPASNTTLVVGDFDQVTFSSLGSKTLSSWVVTDGVYNDITLTNAVVKGGITKLGLILDDDLNNTPPTVDGNRVFVGSYMADNLGDTKDPKLVVEHSATGGRQRFIGRRPGLIIDRQIIGNRKNPVIR